MKFGIGGVVEKYHYEIIDGKRVRVIDKFKVHEVSLLPRKMKMEYTDHCPNCDRKLSIEEEGVNYIIKSHSGKYGQVVTHCPDCKMKLEVIDGQLSVVEE